jgi:2-alkyl-3-oxoalkanoate reductase
MTKQAVLVLGASGFIGRRVVAALQASSWAQPVAASRHVATDQSSDGTRTLRLDATDAAALDTALKSADAVVSCVAGSTQDILTSGRALAAAAARPGAPRLIYLSSLAAYGSTRGNASETAELRGDLGDYSAAKATVEWQLAGLASVVCLRPGIVYGPRSEPWSGLIGRLLLQRRLGDLGEAGNGICNLVHVDDVAATVLRAIETSAAGGEAFNLGGPEPPTWNEYFRLYAQALGVTPLTRLSQSRIHSELRRGVLLKVAEKILGRRNPWADSAALRPWLMDLACHDLLLPVEKARRVLGATWRPLAVGMQETADWLLQAAASR